MRTPSWTAIGTGIGAALGAGTHSLATWLWVCILAGAIADFVSSWLRRRYPAIDECRDHPFRRGRRA